MKNWTLTLIIIGIGFSHCLQAENIVVYRWVDDKNVVHFSQYQPEKGSYTKVRMSSVMRETDNNDEQTSDADKANESIEPKSKYSTQAQCDTAKTNLKTLKAFDNIQYTNDSGKTSLLTDKEKSEQVTLSKKQIELFCLGE